MSSIASELRAQLNDSQIVDAPGDLREVGLAVDPLAARLVRLGDYRHFENMMANKAHALNGGIPRLFHTGHHWPAVSDEHRWA